MLYITGGNVKEGKAGDLQEWVEQNEDTLAETAPDGWTYRGSYFTVHNIGPFDAAVMWEIEKYGDLDTARNTTTKRTRTSFGRYRTSSPKVRAKPYSCEKPAIRALSNPSDIPHRKPPARTESEAPGAD